MTLRSLTANTETSIVKQLTLMLSSATTYLHPLAVVTQRASLKKNNKKNSNNNLHLKSHGKKPTHYLRELSQCHYFIYRQSKQASSYANLPVLPWLPVTSRTAHMSHNSVLQTGSASITEFA